MYKNIHIILSTVLLFLFSCQEENTDTAAEIAFSVTDFRGKEIHFSKHPERVVCLIESALSGLYMLDQGKKIVAVPSDVYKDQVFRYYSQLDARIAKKELPSPGNWDFINVERIIALQPDLVIIWSSQTEAIKNLEKLGIQVYAVMLHGFSDVYKEILDFGTMLDCPGRAADLISYTQKTLIDLKDTFSVNEKKRAYFMWAQSITETSGQNSTVNELFSYAGLENVCELKDEHVTVSVEKIYDWDPDLIIMWYNEKLNPEDVMNEPLLSGLKAVNEQQVFELPSVFSSDFWTLKMAFPVYFTGSHAYGSFDMSKGNMFLDSLYLNLYGTSFQQQ
jgi:iron complex transport system substrate-binding protein